MAKVPENSPLSKTQLRADAEENREVILKVASKAFKKSSTASLNSIAKQAGVGIGTLYRHFPTREALVLEVYRIEVRHVVTAAPELLATRPSFDALRAWMELVAEYGMAKAGLADALRSATTSYDGLAAETYEPIVGALSLLLVANIEAGTIRPGLSPDDVLLMMGFMWRIDPKSDWQDQSRRLLDVFMDGLRTGAPSA